jgi:hypothetical protein
MTKELIKEALKIKEDLIISKQEALKNQDQLKFHYLKDLKLKTN